MNAIPRLSGRTLRFVSGLIKSAAPLRRALSQMVVDRRLEQIDFVAEGNPAPFYMPPTYRKEK